MSNLLINKGMQEVVIHVSYNEYALIRGFASACDLMDYYGVVDLSGDVEKVIRNDFEKLIKER